MRVVFDLDDTICVHKRRNFVEAQPIPETVEKMRKMKEAGVHIIIYTARGQNSCKGDIKLIYDKYYDDISDWLIKHNIPFDEIVFGKPLGDLYVDDKGMSLSDFKDMKFEKLSGKSGAEIFRCGNIVNKKCKNSWEQAEWYELAKSHGVNVPDVHSVVLDKIEMEYIDGKIDKVDVSILNKMLANIFLFMHTSTKNAFNIDDLIKRVDEHLEYAKSNHNFDKLKKFLRNSRSFLGKNATFCHGDYTISNCLLKEKNIYLIDPNLNENYSSYLLDFAKLRFSLDGGEKFIGNDVEIEEDVLGHFTSVIKFYGNENIIIALEATHWLRLLKYEKDYKRIVEIINKAKELEAML